MYRRGAADRQALLQSLTVPELAALLGKLALLPKRAAGRPRLLAAALEALEAEPALPDRPKVPCMTARSPAYLPIWMVCSTTEVHVTQ